MRQDQAGLGRWCVVLVLGVLLVGQTATATANAMGSAGTLYGSDRDGNLFTIDVSTGIGTFVGAPIADPPIGVTEIEYDNIGMTAFAQHPDGSFEGNFFDINTGLPTSGPIANGGSHTGLEYVGTTLYGTVIFGPGGPSDLRTLNPATGASTLIGSTGVGPISGIAYDNKTGVMYGIAGGPGPAGFYTINLSTGAATLVGTTGMQAGSLQFGPDGDLYAGGTGPDAGELHRINPANGVSTFVGITGFGSVTGLTLEVPVGGCCQCDGEDQFCTTETEEDCAALGGEYLGANTACGDCGEAFPEQCLSPQTLIIKQGACPAPVNPGGNGVTPMVLVGALDFDASDVDVSSLALSRCDGVGGSVAPNDGPPGPPGARVRDINHPNPDPATCETGGCTCNNDQSSDGIDDLALKFNTDEMAAAMNLGAETPGTVITLVLTGTLNDGTAFSAADCIRIVGAGGDGDGASSAMAVGSNLHGVWVDVSPLDDTLEEGGYTSFNRSYAQTSVVTVTAPRVPYGYPDWILANFWIDGVRHQAFWTTVQVTMNADTSVIVEYRKARFNPGRTTPGVAGGKTQQQ